MIMDSFHNYTILMAFQYIYKYEGKKAISVERLKHYRKILLEEILDEYKNGKDCDYLQEVDQWSGEVSFKEINEDEALQDFLDKYEDYIYLNNNIVSLKENVIFEDISELIRQIRVKENVPSRFDIIHHNDKLMNALEISSIEKIINEYSKVEEMIENLYNKLFTEEDTEKIRKNIKSLLFIRLCFFTKIFKMPDYRVDAFRIISGSYGKKANKDYDYDKYPINLDLYEKEDLDFDNVLEDIDDRLFDINQYAIFGKNKNVLYLDKIENQLDNFDMSEYGLSFNPKEEIDPFKDYSDIIETDMLAREQFEEKCEAHPENVFEVHDSSDEFWIFYMNYLNNLDKYMSIYGETKELLLAKRRLLYAMDKPELMIYEQKNFEKELEKCKSIELDEDSFSFFVDEIYFMAKEVFMVPSDEYTIRKLLLVGTYYNLTNDVELKKIIEEFKNNTKYEFFYDIMINNCTNKNPEELSQDVKKLILRLNDK